MSKGSKKAARHPAPAKPGPTPAPAQTAAAAAAGAGIGSTGAAAMSADTAAGSSWLDSSDPRRRMIGNIVLVGVWIYIAALWLLALDQTFNWGIFGPKTPPLP